MADITLTAAVRSNLSTLQSTANLISDTQERLATGKKVNSALDNPNSFFTASSLNSRASDLGNLQDDIGQSVSTLEAADKGIQGIDKLLDAAKGKANQALQSKDADTRAKYASEFNELRTQIEDIAKDSGYKGKNLLGGDGNDLLVKFNEDGSSKLNISSVDYTDLDSEDAAFKLGKISDTVAEVDAIDGKADFDLGISKNSLNKTTGFTNPGLADTATDLNTATEFADGGVIHIDSGDGGVTDLTIAAGVSLDDLQTSIRAELGQDATTGSATVAIEAGQVVISGVNKDIELSYTPSGGGETGGELNGLNVEKSVTKETTLAELDAFEIGDRVSFNLGSGPTTDFDISATSTIDELTTAINGVTDVTASFVDGVLTVDNETIDNQITTSVDEGKEFTFSFVGNGSGAQFSDSSTNVVGQDIAAVEGRGWGSDELIEESLDQIRQAQLDLRAQASTFGTNLSVVTNRQDFTADLINTLEVGAGKLTLADSNLEGANLAALNTQNSIATSTLSLATQAGQSVLQLIR
ncbi:Flagellin A [Pseudovibrio sp. Ad5]|uniref:flagellin N-terminal helical domain-containing protein n=1 Tax=Pseudovibrio sp. Ad5 TaxID=989436 RepID=UPI0007AE3D23|nr:hypothetical protein [Pseudovibrio sp. Ad5]KZK93537.1 Flagellin A [Pseudovibrio sp. Ad5]